MDQGKAHCTCVGQKREHGRDCAEDRRGPSSFDFTAMPDKEEGEFSAKHCGARWEPWSTMVSSEKFQGHVPGLPQFPRKNLRTWKHRVWPKVSKRLSGDRWEWWMKLHNTHPDNQQLGNCWLVCPLSLLVAQGDLHFSGVKAFATKILVFDFVGFPPPTPTAVTKP